MEELRKNRKSPIEYKVTYFFCMFDVFFTFALFMRPQLNWLFPVFLTAHFLILYPMLF